MNIHSTSRCAAIAFLLMALCVTVSHAQNLSSPQDCGDEDLVCLVLKRTETYQRVDKQSFEVLDNYECHPLNGEDDVTYDLPLPQDFIDSHPSLDQGLTHISIPGGCINGLTVTYPPDAVITTLPARRSLLPRAKEGNITVLVVRATEKGYPELRPNGKIREMLFDNITGSFKNQMNACSFGKFNVLKAQGPGINDGILEVNLSIDVSDMSNREVESKYLVPLLAPYGGENAFDHVMYCIPYGTRTGRNGTGYRNWVAYALVNHARSVYNHFWCGLLTAAMHEAGHNLGLHHAGQDGYVYGDATGMMGYSTYGEYGPRLCFNAQKNWHLGWYDDRSVDLTSSIRSTSWGGRVTAFVDYNVTPPGDVVLIRVGNLYVQYNRARDFNEGTREYRNRAVIVSTPTTGSSKSTLEAALANNIAVSNYAYPNFDETGHDLVFNVCNQVEGPRTDYIHLSIHLNDGVQSSTCAQILSALTHTQSEPTTSAMASHSVP